MTPVMEKPTAAGPEQSPAYNEPETPPSSGTAVDSAAMRIAVVIPAYNEAASIRDIAIRALAQSSLVIIVDDGSEDGTAQALSKLPVTLLKNPQNMGKGASLRRGMGYALEQNVAAVITLDGDGQHEPEDISRLLQMAEHHPRHVIVGARLRGKEAFPRQRYYANRVADFWLSWAAGYRIDDSQSGFRLYPAEMLQRLRISQIKTCRFEFESEVLIEAARLGYRSATVPITAIYGTQARDSHFRPVYDIFLIARMVAWKLVSRGFYLGGFYRAFIKPPT